MSSFGLYFGSFIAVKKPYFDFDHSIFNFAFLLKMSHILAQLENAICRLVPSFCLDIFSSLILIFILAYQFQILKYFLCHY
jgi:hypothetical protein